MFTFNHVTSIGLTAEEYAKRLAAGETNLVKGENTFYREIVTEMTVPVTAKEAAEFILHDESGDASSSSESIKLGDKKFTVSESVKALIVGLKLAVNQRVQTDNRNGGGMTNTEIVQSVLKQSKPGSEDFNAAIGALVSQRTIRKFAEKWMVDHPEWKVR